MGVRGMGATKEQAFEQAALALTAVITELGSVEPRESIAIQCQAPDEELLLVDWLNSLVYEMATRGWLFGRFEVRIADGTLEGRAWGEPVDVARHQPAVEVKGASYTALKVMQTPQGAWIAQCVVDV
jgi:tRNA nucleotidyltransferase (CCA-adding enzyme)